MNRRSMVIGGVLTLISLPVALPLIEAVSFHVRNRNNGFIVSSGRRREYLLYVPASYSSSRSFSRNVTRRCLPYRSSSRSSR